MPGSGDSSLLPPPRTSTLHCQPLRQTPARCETRVRAIHAGPHPFPALARVRAGGEGRSISCPEFAAVFFSLLQFSCRAVWSEAAGGGGGAYGGSGAQTPTHPRSSEWLTPETRSAAGGRGRETWARVEVGVACCWGWAHQPPALRMLFDFQFSQPPPCTGRKTFLPLAPLRRGEGKGEGLALGQRAGMADCTCTWHSIPVSFACQIPAIWFVLPVTLFRGLEGRGNAEGS